MNKSKTIIRGLLLLSSATLLTHCSTMTDEEIYTAIHQKNQAIAHEEKGNFFYGRRYYIPYTRFWGYLRSPGQNWGQAKLVIFDESKIKSPDRLAETDSSHKKEGIDHGFDANYEYKIHGNYTGKMAYEPNTNQALPIFQITGYELINKNPGWLFSPAERYSVEEVSIRPDVIPYSLR